MSRGPKPPIAPKPRLATPSEWRASVYVINSLNKCSNGKLPCVDRGLYEEHRSTPECSESEADEDYIVAPRAPPGEDEARDAGCVENAVTGPPEAGEEEEGQDGGEGCGPAGSAWAVLSEQADRDVAPAPEDAEGPDCAGAVGTEDQTLASEEEEEKLAEEHRACSLEDEDGEAEPGEPGDGGAEPGDGWVESLSDSIPAHLEVVEDTVVGGEEEPGAPGTPQEAEEEDAEPGHSVDEEGEGDDAGEEPPEDEESATGVPEAEVASDDPEVSREACEDAAGYGGQHGGQDEPADPAEAEAGQDPRQGEDLVQDEAAEESCHIIPFESDSVDDLVPPLSASPYEFFPTESTSFCSESYPPYSASAGESAQEPGPEERAERDPEAGPGRERRGSAQGGAGEEGAPVPDVLVLPEDEDANPYEMGVGPTCGADPGEAETPGAQAALQELSPDAEGGLVPIDRKNVMARARPHSGKLAGYVPETVPSFSVEGREIPVSLYREPEACGLEGHSIKRKEDNLSLPCVIGSSGSFSQRSHLPSSGTSTPSSMVDIPPPFDLACITKKPITKSSPSLLVESEPPDKHSKKKKSSFKRFLALTFKKKTESKMHVDVNVSSSRSSSESSYHGPARLLEMDRRSLSNSPQLRARTGKLRACDSPSSLIFCREGKRKGVPFSRTVSRVESFEDRSRPPFLPLPLTKPRSISFPNADTSDYENIPAMNSDYENIQIPPRRPARAGTFTKLFEDQSRALSTANENDGYVDMSSFNAFESKPQSADPEAESAYTEPYKVCPISAVAPKEDLTSEEERGSSEEEEDRAARDPTLPHKVEGQSRAHVIAQELLSSEKAYVEMLQHLYLDFHGAVVRALDEMDYEGKDPVGREELRRGLSELPAIHDLHQGILEELEERLAHWEGQQKVADVFLAREQEFAHHATHILQFDRYLSLLGENCLHAPRLAAAVREFEQSQQGGGQNVKHRLLRVVRRLFQYEALLTDYLNNLCPDSAEYDDTQGALTLISKITDRANDSMEQGENLQKLVHIEHSVRGQGDLLQPGREFLKEGTLMKVTGKNRRPRHLFLMSDVLLYTYPQKDGKYRLKSALAVASMKVSRPVMEKVPYALKIETPESCLTLSARYEERKDRGSVGQDFARGKVWNRSEHEALEEVGAGRQRGRTWSSAWAGRVRPCDPRAPHLPQIVCRNCSRNKYPLKYLKDRMAKVCDGCYGELKKRGGDAPGMMRERPLSMSFPLSSARFSSSAFSSVFHSINPSAFRKQRKVPSALTEVAASGEGSAISGYLNRCKKGKRHWKKLWFVINGKVLYTYAAREDTVALESMPLLGFTVASSKEEGSSEASPTFHLYHKKTLFYSFKAEDSSLAQRWIEAMEDASVL
ncbi:PREDICTED: FYVE, RhoGEF and PH domain-containing protein 5 [Bison bison bison]|uniref:FYVE, RhoGEF and PH domain-containing protein 5 n=1 Tax=Bison bison bison TaxID=43346 RepID=A0A6P3J9W9_BISBB|nr:PREDICTED: FYVE, RhoGEF and PH domain-containing protein 5 [Bison bison bison]